VTKSRFARYQFIILAIDRTMVDPADTANNDYGEKKMEVPLAGTSGSGSGDKIPQKLKLYC